MRLGPEFHRFGFSLGKHVHRFKGNAARVPTLAGEATGSGWAHTEHPSQGICSVSRASSASSTSAFARANRWSVSWAATSSSTRLALPPADEHRAASRARLPGYLHVGMTPQNLAVAILDVNETLSDLAPLARRFEEVGAPGDLLDTWFAATLRDGMALAASGRYAGFPEVAHAALRPLLARVRGLASPVDEAADHVLAGIGTLRLHPDVEPGLRRMRDAGLRIVTLTNGSAATTAELLERAAVGELVERHLDVGEAGRWKPAPEPYEHACRALGVAIGAAVLIAVHPWDVHGAKCAGLRGAWLDRHGDPYPSVFLEPDARASELPALVDQLVE